MREGTVFSLSVHTSTGEGGTPFPGLDRAGYPLPRSGGGGAPFPDLGRGYPLSRPEKGLPPISRSGTWTGGEGYPQLEQHSVYLVRGEQYASCVYAGGLSCFKYIFWHLKSSFRIFASARYCATVTFGDTYLAGVAQTCNYGVSRSHHPGHLNCSWYIEPCGCTDEKPFLVQ